MRHFIQEGLYIYTSMIYLKVEEKYNIKISISVSKDKDMYIKSIISSRHSSDVFMF